MTWTVPDQGEPTNDLQAVLFQSTLDALVAGDALTGVVSGCAVSQRGAGANMSVDVASGTISLLGVQASVSSGNVAIGAADATNPRLDLVVSDGSGTKSVIAGTAAASPKEPTLDTTTYILLAQVYVPAAASSIVTADITDRRVIVPGTGMGLGIYGDGSDGTVTFDGTTTILGIAPSSSQYILTRDIFLAGGTINSGVKIKTAGFRIFCQGTLVNNGTIHWNGNAATSTSSAGTANVSTNGPLTQGGTVTFGTAGGAGATGTGSNGGTGGASGYGGKGGDGGAGSGTSGGTGGGLTTPAVGDSTPRHLLALFFGVPSMFAYASVHNMLGGTGGGGGGGDTTNRGGSGGSAGGTVVLAVRNFAGTGNIQAVGGAAFAPTTGNCGGAGGGGGGVVFVVSGSVSAGAIPGQTVSVAGGAHANGVGTGVNGVDGSAGIAVLLPN